MVLIVPSDPSKLLDMENIVAFENKQVIGFIYEPIGPITMPLYSIQLYPEFVDKITTSGGFTSMREALHGKLCFVVKSRLKLINSKLDSIMKKKGCDASNMFDEEVGKEEQEFSDDDEEKVNRRKGSMEDGELPPESSYASKKRSGSYGKPH